MGLICKTEETENGDGKWGESISKKMKMNKEKWRGEME